jgi:hypothetical protein
MYSLDVLLLWPLKLKPWSGKVRPLLEQRQVQRRVPILLLTTQSSLENCRNARQDTRMDRGSPTSNMENEEGESIKPKRPEVIK